MNIPYITDGFSPSLGSGNINVTWAELAWAAVSYGKDSGCYYLGHPGHSLLEKIYRLSLLYTCLTMTDTHACKSILYKRMDPTEKGFASYFLGMTLTKLFASRFLSTPLLWHVSMASQTISCRPGNSRPDLIGCQSTLNQWIVAEAKGRSGSFDSLALSKAKRQAQMITTINCQRPRYCFGAESYFAPHLSLRVDDPPSDEDAVLVEFDVEQALDKYYSIFPVLQELGSREEVAGSTYFVLNNRSVGVAIGLPSMVDEQGQKTEPSRLVSSLSVNTPNEDLEFLGADRFFIRLDSRWTDQEMEKEPHLRKC
jgi:hypothetical protein